MALPTIFVFSAWHLSRRCVRLVLVFADATPTASLCRRQRLSSLFWPLSFRQCLHRLHAMPLDALTFVLLKVASATMVIFGSSPLSSNDSFSSHDLPTRGTHLARTQEIKASTETKTESHDHRATKASPSKVDTIKSTDTAASQMFECSTAVF